jgi:hypothetical protein
MNNDARNTRVVVCLILAMTAGARLLLWLEPGQAKSESLPPLTAAGGIPVEAVVIEYARPDEVRTVGVDCHLLPDGSLVGSLDDPQVRVVVVGTEADELLVAQKKSLLALLGSMTQARDGDLVRVELDPASDVRRDPTLPRQAYDLLELLVRKGMIE